MIRLLPLTKEALEAAARDLDAFAREQQVRLEPYRELVDEIARQTARLPAATVDGVHWGGYLAADAASGAVLGTCAFTAPPRSDGTVEIAYFTFPGNEGRGIATAMARELLALAATVPSAPRVIAHTRLGPGASARILGNLGFEPDGEADDPDEGRVLRWVHGPGPPPR